MVEVEEGGGDAILKKTGRGCVLKVVVIVKDDDGGG